MLLDRTTFVIRERVGLIKLTDTYDIFDPAGGQLGVAKDEPGELAKYLRLIVKKRMLPTTLNVYENESSPPVLSLHRNVALFRPSVTASAGGRELGRFQAKALTIGGAFRMFDASGNEVGLVQGNWRGREFKMTDLNGRELGQVSKQWGGMAKELFTNADTYVIAVAAGVRGDLAPLVLAAGFAIDLIFKEDQG